MSTTNSAAIAAQYAGKGRGSILVFDYELTSRGADLSFLSQFPHEKALACALNE